MDLQVTYSAQYGLEWRIVLPEKSSGRNKTEIAPEFCLPDDLAADEFPTQEAVVLPELRPRTHVERR